MGGCAAARTTARMLAHPHAHQERVEILCDFRLCFRWTTRESYFDPQQQLLAAAAAAAAAVRGSLIHRWHKTKDGYCESADAKHIKSSVVCFEGYVCFM